MMRTLSIRRTAFLWLAGLMSVIGICAAASSYLLVQNEAADFLDNQLRQIALYVGDEQSVLTAGSDGAAQHDPEDDFIVQVWDASGLPLRQSHPAFGIARQPATGFTDIATGRDRWRVYTLARPDRTVQISQDIRVRQELATTAALQAALPIIVLIPMSLLILGWIIDRVMARLNRLAGAITTRDTAAEDPLPTLDVPTEVVPFVSAINLLLARLQALLERQRHFISDAAHELRTLLAALQIQIDNLRNDDRHGRFSERLTELEAGIGRATALVRKLLLLARYDAEEAAPAPRPIDLVQLALDTVARLAPLAESRNIDLGITRQDRAIAMGTLADFEVVLDNLVENTVC